MEFIITLSQDEDGMWVAECPAIPGCVSQGRTQDEASENAREAIRLCLDIHGEAQIQGLHRLGELGPIDAARIE
jgi:predicted RNase H-like HicB family nuclease